MNQVTLESRGNLHELGNVRFSRWRSARNLHRLNNFNSFEYQSARNLHRLNFYWEYSASGAEVRKEIEKLKLLSLCRFRAL